MRIVRFELVRFGKFTDRCIDLPATKPDLHVIVGPNEAGKSTLRAALADLLFGIEARTPFNFAHHFRDICLAAEIQRNGERLAFRRLKRNRDSLRDADDRPLPDHRLAEFLGAVDREFYARMFALDRRKLEEGGVEILQAKNDLGRMLFEASAGFASLGVLRHQLEEEADGLWAPRRKRERTYYAALDRFDDGERMLREVMVSARQWHEAKQRLDAAARDLQVAIDRHLHLETTRARLDRIRRVAPHLLKRRGWLTERTSLGDVVSLPTDAGNQLKLVEVTLATAQTVIAQQQALVDRAEAERARITVDHAVLGHREAIIRLGEERNRVRDHPGDIEKRQAELQLLRAEAAALIRELGWTPAADEELAKRMPTRAARAEIMELFSEHARLSEQERLTVEARARAQHELDMLERELAGIPDCQVPLGLMTAREAVRALGDFSARRRQLEEMAGQARLRLAAATDELTPWSGPIEALDSMRLPEDEVAQAIAARAGEIDDRLRMLAVQLVDACRDLDEKRLIEGQVRRQRQPPTAETIVAARVARDAAWVDIRDQRVNLGAAAEDYEAKVSHADDLADRRYLAADEVKELEHLRNGIELTQLRISQLETEMEGLKIERRRLAEDWVRMLPEGLGGLQPVALSSWIKRRRYALSEAGQVANAIAASSAFEGEVSEAFAALGEALLTAGHNAAAASALAPPAQLALADSVVAEAETARTRREELARHRTKLQGDLAELSNKAMVAKRAMEDWQRRWGERLRQVHLPVDLTPIAARTAVEELAKLAETLDRIRQLQQARIDTMQRDLDAYGDNAKALAASLAPDLLTSDAEMIVVSFMRRLQEAEKAKERQERATAELSEAHKAMADARSRQEQAEASLRPLFDRAGVHNLDRLRAAIDQSERAAAVDAEVDHITHLILENGDGLPLAELEAEVAAEDLSSIAARLAEVDRLREEARSGREQSLLAKRAAEAELAGINGAPEAAKAEACRQEALAEMAAAAERYVAVFVAARLLRWAIERFRAEKQDPLLRSAAETFRGLTLGGFVDLTVDYEGDTPHLLGRRTDGTHVGVDGMSEGTRDQLYLALRLAAIKLHLQKGHPLPFIADDLFVNFDDDRAAAGFRALAGLASETQVIFLSHHKHLVDIAKQAVGGGLSILSL